MHAMESGASGFGNGAGLSGVKEKEHGRLCYSKIVGIGKDQNSYL